MKFCIRHEIKGRIRIHISQNKMTYKEADILLYYLHQQKNITKVKIYDRTADISICYVGRREDIIALLKTFQYSKVQVPEGLLDHTGRELNAFYQEKLIRKIVLRLANKLFVPYPIREVYTGLKSFKYIVTGMKYLAQGKIEVPVLDATAIGVSIIRNDITTASSIMFLLGIGELLEEWTHKKSVGDLARSMSLNIGKVWLVLEENEEKKEILVSAAEIKHGDKVMVHIGNVIPFDGVVSEGDAMVNQASLTGESVAVRKSCGGYVYAGTVIEEGELTVCVAETSGSTKYEKIVTMIEESEKLKSNLEGNAEHLADKLVPCTLLGTGLTYIFTKNITKALSVLMVDFSCAMKLAMPIAVLSAIREASLYNITVKGGKYLEAISEADTIVFDKTGTLTKAKPTVAKIVTFAEENEDECLRIAACMEEHFPHSMAKAVVEAAKDRKLEHEEMHSKVDYIVAHGISTKIGEKKVIIGSYHFIFEDEKCVMDENTSQKLSLIPMQYTHLYLAIDQKLVAVICLEDPLREEAGAVINSLKMAGIKKIVMMTGDSERTAASIAKKVGVDQYYSEVLPEDKASFVENERACRKKVIMIGDGINDAPALSAADVGIAISDGAEIAREIADITIAADNLYEIVTLKLISNNLMKRIDKNYKYIVGFNTGLIVMGVAGVLQPTTSALLHNTSTLAIGLKSMQNLLG